jgi:outer membrane protein OmpU
MEFGMNKLLWATTALFVVGGIGVAAADVSISGNSRFRYETWSDDQQDVTDEERNRNNSQMGEILMVWLNADMVADSGLEYGVGVRFRSSSSADVTGAKVGSDGITVTGGKTSTRIVDRNYIYLRDDWGQFKLGNDWAPVYNMSLGGEWRGTGVGQFQAGYTGATEAIKNAYQTTSGKNRKLAYYTPNLGGFKAGLSYSDAGAGAKTDSTSYAFTYGFDMMGGNAVTVGYGAEKQAESAAKNDDKTVSQYGFAATMGDFLVSAIRVGEDTGDNVEKSGTEFEVAYDLSDQTVLNLLHFDSKVSKGPNDGDKFNSTQVGFNYEVAPGLLLGAAHTMFDGTSVSGADSEGSATRLQVRLNF